MMFLLWLYLGIGFVLNLLMFKDQEDENFEWWIYPMMTVGWPVFFVLGMIGDFRRG